MNDMLLVLLAGQSNMAGRGTAEPDDLKNIPGLFRFTGDFRWLPAIEPIHRDRPFVGTFDQAGNRISSPDPWDNIPVGNGGEVRGVGPGRTFGRLLLEANPGRRVGLIPAAVGGTPLASWKRGGEDIWVPGEYPYNRAVSLAKAAMKHGRIVAVLWHQGETDAQQNNLNYKNDLREVIRNFRDDLKLGVEVPFLLGELGSFYGEEILAHVPRINQAMHELASELPSVGIVRTKDLTCCEDSLHFDTTSARELGRRYFTEFAHFIHPAAVPQELQP